MYRPFYPEVTCSATQLERTKVENNAQIEAPRGGEILYSAPLIRRGKTSMYTVGIVFEFYTVPL